MHDHKNICEACGQTTTYDLELNPGSVNILKVMAQYIERKGINAVHPRKEVEGHGLSSNEVGNLSRIRFHGLVAKIEGETGNYCLTSKGLDFLNGAPIPTIAIVKKGTDKVPAHTIGYGEGVASIEEYGTGWETYWTVNGYEVREGRVIKTPPVKSNPEYQKPMFV